MERMVVSDFQCRFEPDRPARGPRPPAEIRIFVIEKEVVVKPADLAEAVAADEQTAAGEPIDPLPPVAVDRAAFSDRPAAQLPEQRSKKGRVVAGRWLARAAGVA